MPTAEAPFRLFLAVRMDDPPIVVDRLPDTASALPAFVEVQPIEGVGQVANGQLCWGAGRPDPTGLTSSPPVFF